MPNLPDPPLQTPIVESGRAAGTAFGVMTKPYADWLLALVQQSATVAQAVGKLALTAQAGAIGLTPIVSQAAGLYRVSWHARVTTPASGSSSLTVTITSTEGASVCTQSGPALIANVTTAPQSGSVMVKADPNTPISLSTAYASVGTAMLYDLDVVVERMS